MPVIKYGYLLWTDERFFIVSNIFVVHREISRKFLTPQPHLPAFLCNFYWLYSYFWLRLVWNEVFIINFDMECGHKLFFYLCNGRIGFFFWLFSFLFFSSAQFFLCVSLLYVWRFCMYVDNTIRGPRGLFIGELSISLLVWYFYFPRSMSLRVGSVYGVRTTTMEQRLFRSKNKVSGFIFQPKLSEWVSALFHSFALCGTENYCTRRIW